MWPALSQGCLSWASALSHASVLGPPFTCARLVPVVPSGLVPLGQGLAAQHVAALGVSHRPPSAPGCMGTK